MSRRRFPTLEEQVELLLVVVLVDEWTSRIPRRRSGTIDYNDYRRQTQSWVDEHRAEIDAAVERARRLPDFEQLGAAFEGVWALFEPWAHEQDPDLLEKPAGLY